MISESQPSPKSLYTDENIQSPIKMKVVEPNNGIFGSTTKSTSTDTDSEGSLESPQKPRPCMIGITDISQFVEFKAQDQPEAETDLSKFKGQSHDSPLAFVISQIVGRKIMIRTPFDLRTKLYMDFTASGQDIHQITKHLSKIVEKFANTHTETSHTGAYMNHQLHEAERRILYHCKADHQKYYIAAGGSGSTWAMEMAQKFFGTYVPPKTLEVMQSLGDNYSIESIKAQLRKENQLPLVLVSHYEHHSNETTWRNQLCDVLRLRSDKEGEFDLNSFEKIIQKFTAKESGNKRPVIVSLSAGSNVTGLLTPIEKVCRIAKQYDETTPCLFDYGAVAPYVPIDLSKRTSQDRPLIDGVYISTHKLLGGPGTTGVLIFNKALYHKHLKPTHGGGGTVDFVDRVDEEYATDFEEREKSGTPAIQQIIKTALAFDLKAFLLEAMMKREHELCERFLRDVEKMESKGVLIVHGTHDPKKKIPIFSFNIRHKDRFLHPAFVIRLFNDLFGIQGRPGSSCAGPYALDLLGITDEEVEKIKFWMFSHPDIGDDHGFSWMKPGWSRINLHYTMTDDEYEYFMKALEFIVEHGHKFLTIYDLGSNGTWIHRTNPVAVAPKCGLVEEMERDYYVRSEKDRKALFNLQLEEAERIMKELPESEGLEAFEEITSTGCFCRIYAEKGNVQNKEAYAEKAKKYEDYVKKQSGKKKECFNCFWQN